MTRSTRSALWILVLLMFVSAPAGFAEDDPPRTALTFTERVACVEKVEDVYWSHRIWPASNPEPRPPRAEIVSRDAVAAAVDASLRSEAILETQWGESLSPGEIQAELDRIAASTLDPDLLLDVFAALDHDPTLIGECFVRPRLVERRLQERYFRDVQIHGELRSRAESALLTGASTIDVGSSGGEVSEVRWSLDHGSYYGDPESMQEGRGVLLAPAEWRDLTGRLAEVFDGPADEKTPGSHADSAADLRSLVGRGFSPLIEEDDAFVAVEIVKSGDDTVTVAVATWPKTPFGDWIEARIVELDPAEPAVGTYTLPHVDPKSFCVDDTWESISDNGAATPRFNFASVWTGTELIIWGGDLWGTETNTGARYDLATDSWTATSTSGAASARNSHTGVWTGTEMVVWGGADYPTWYNTGGRYNPSTNGWTATSTTGAPSARGHHTAVWSGTEMIVWGGGDTTSAFLTGGRYNPTSNTWSATSLTGAPSVRVGHTAVWTGSEMIIWGGNYGAPTYNDGRRYSPATDSWVPTSLADVPEARRDHTAVWTGTEMIVWGGYGDTWIDTGGRYDPVSDSWTATSTSGAPSPRYSHSAVWTGTEMIIWGGGTNSVPENNGGRYDPSGDVWMSTSTTDAPAPRTAHTAAWPGSPPKMIVALGGNTSGPLQNGGLYCASGVVPYDFGDAPDPTYPTLLASDGARHRGGGSLWLGMTLDYDDDGQPTATADGDDNDGIDDEDGVTFTSVISPGGTAGVDVVASEACLLNAWVDFNDDGDWADAGEQIFTDQALTAGVNNLQFAVPGDASVGTTIARFRADSAGGLSFSGAAGDGEVEDHEVTVVEIDFGDAPDPSYPTLLAFDGARHVIDGTTYLGATVDAEPDGQPTANANGDDNDGNDDEDGISFITWPVAGQLCTIRVTASTAGVVNAWIDYNADGDWADAGEQIFTDVAVVAGQNNLDYAIPITATTGVDTFARFRFSTVGGLSFDGLALDGEVEDYKMGIIALDYGDAPDPTYPTLDASDGARHIISGGLHLGAGVDLDADGQPTAGADGDDLDGSDDEDGVAFTSGIGIGLNAFLDVTASGSGLLNAWIDFNADGDWADAGEQVFSNHGLVTGINSLSFAVPAGATLGTTYARFRLNTSGGLSYDGYATDGEVEDYVVEIVEGPDLEIEMVASAVHVPSGDALSYTITVTNNGPLTATSVTVTDTLPGELIFVSSNPGAPDCSFAGGTLSCDLGAMAPTATAQITLETTLDHPVWGTVSNTSSVAASELDPITANNTAAVDTRIALFVDGFESGDLTAWD